MRIFPVELFCDLRDGEASARVPDEDHLVACVESDGAASDIAPRRPVGKQLARYLCDCGHGKKFGKLRNRTAAVRSSTRKCESRWSSDQACDRENRCRSSLIAEYPSWTHSVSMADPCAD